MEAMAKSQATIEGMETFSLKDERKEEKEEVYAAESLFKLPSSKDEDEYEQP